MQFLEIETLKQWQRALSLTRDPSARMPRLGLAILFVDSRLGDIDALPSSITQSRVGIQNTIGVRLSRQQDGILQISGVLQYLTAIDSIHIVGRAEEDCFWLGNACLRSSTLPKYHKYLANWRLYGDRDRGEVPISLYGDRPLVRASSYRITQQLHRLTGCPVTLLEWQRQHHSLGPE